jgi:hypothetical protein
MKCPYCNSKMETGVLEGQRYLLWAKQPHKLSYRPKAGEVLLGEKAVSSANKTRLYRIYNLIPKAFSFVLIFLFPLSLFYKFV